jgi:Putative peptidoglycan binding domain
MSIRHLLIATSAVALVSGCSWFGNHNANTSSQYQSSMTSQNSSNAATVTTSGPATGGRYQQGEGQSGNRYSGPNKTNAAQASNMNLGGTAHYTQAELRQAQEMLQQQGLYHGKIDGKMGPQTRAALVAFQKQKGIPQSAQLDNSTKQDLQIHD